MNKCKWCNIEDDTVYLTPSKTMYVTDLPDNDPNNPNRHLMLCSFCAEEYNEVMDQQWREFYSNRI